MSRIDYKSSDYMVRATAANGAIRAFAVRSTDLVEEARKRHGTTGVVTAALGRLLSGGVMMGAMMKGERDVLTLQIRSDGPIQGMTVTAYSNGEVKGFPLNPAVDLDYRIPEMKKLDVGRAVGNGTLTVIKDMGLKEPYSSQVELQSGEIGDDLTYYFAASEQTPSSVALGVQIVPASDDDLGEDGGMPSMPVLNAGGFIVQLMPNTPDEVIDRLEANLRSADPVTTMMENGMTPENMLEKVLEGFDLQINDREPVRFACDCSKEKFSRGLASLKDEELQEIIDEGKDIEVRCHFCNATYNYTIDELKEIAASKNA